MEITTLCAVVAALRVLPNRSQFFQYESVSLGCEQQGSSTGWRVKRNTTIKTNEECPSSWNTRNKSTCVIGDLYPSDSGVYWCESAAGECSDAVSITVTAGPLILQSPVLPVMEGEAVTLSCTDRTASSSNLTTDFYKNDLLMGSSSTGNFTIHSVSKGDEGLYKCSVSGAGESPGSRLIVRGLPERARSAPGHIVLPVVGVYLSLVSVMLLCLWRSHTGEIDPEVVLYTEVTCTHKCSNKGGALKRSSSVAVYRPVRQTGRPHPVLTYSAAAEEASVPPASVPPASVPPASVPPASVPPASVPPASVPRASRVF